MASVMPITEQPGGQNDFGMVKRNPDNLPGLQSLAHLRELKIKQRRPECLEMFNCWEFTNKYDVWDEHGTQVFFLKEESDCCARMCCANARPLEVSFQDMSGQELLRFHRPLRCMECPCNFCYPDWTQLLVVYHQDQELGKIREVPVCCTRKHLEVFDKQDQKLFDISGPCCPIGCGTDVPFLIENEGGVTVGEITKKWRGWCSEAFTDSDTFKIEFPDSADVTTRALLMGATMLVDYMYFEKKDNNDHGAGGFGG